MERSLESLFRAGTQDWLSSQEEMTTEVLEAGASLKEKALWLIGKTGSGPLLPRSLVLNKEEREGTALPKESKVGTSVGSA